MDDPFSQLPKAAVLVYAGVLVAASGNTAFAGQASLEVRDGDVEQPSKAPTCGPACHVHGYREQQAQEAARLKQLEAEAKAKAEAKAEAPPQQEPASPVLPIAPTCGPACHTPGYHDIEPLPEPDPVAPTCGPSCHDGGGTQDVVPPPIPPSEKNGCAVVSADEPQTDLALLGLGLSLGIGMSIAGRRRTRATHP